MHHREEGPRYNSKQTNIERNSYENLILLCGRHHTIIDGDPETYTVEKLLKFKEDHQNKEFPLIRMDIEEVAEALFKNYQTFIFANKGSSVSVNSPSVIRADSVKVLPKKTKIIKAPALDSIAADAKKASYILYLIDRYQLAQKLDKEKVGRRKYMLIYSAIKSSFGSKWDALHVSKFESLVELLKKRIDNTKVGRVRKNRDQKFYSTFEEHNQK